MTPDLTLSDKKTLGFWVKYSGRYHHVQYGTLIEPWTSKPPTDLQSDYVQADGKATVWISVHEHPNNDPSERKTCCGNIFEKVVSTLLKNVYQQKESSPT